MATAKASVVTARNSPFTRKAGSPTRTATTAPAAAEAPMVRNRSRFARAIRLAATTPPTPTMPAWPRLTVPLQPVRTTSDRAAIPRSSVALTRLVWLGVANSGTARAPPATAATSAARQRRTSGRAATAAGSGRAAPVRDHEDSSAVSARLPSRRRISSATRITAANTTVVTAC